MVKWLKKLLGIEALEQQQQVLNDRLTDIARHFVLKRDDKGQVTETLADRFAKKDGKPLPMPAPIRNWDRYKRFLEANDAVPRQ